MTCYHITEQTNIGKIMQDGLVPKIGKRSEQAQENTPKIYLFGSKSDAENALLNWLGEEFENTPIAMIELKVPTKFLKHEEFEYTCQTRIQPEQIKRVISLE